MGDRNSKDPNGIGRRLIYSSKWDPGLHQYKSILLEFNDTDRDIAFLISSLKHFRINRIIIVYIPFQQFFLYDNLALRSEKTK